MKIIATEERIVSRTEVIEHEIELPCLTQTTDYGGHENISIDVMDKKNVRQFVDWTYKQVPYTWMKAAVLRALDIYVLMDDDWEKAVSERYSKLISLVASVRLLD